MTNYDKGKKPEQGTIKDFDHIVFWVGNAKQAALHYCTHFGFQHYCYSGLETGNRNIASHVVKQDKIIFMFQSALKAGVCHEMDAHLVKHGDGVRDVAFAVEDLDSIIAKAKEMGATIEKKISSETDENGTIRRATLRTFGDTVHTLIDRTNYKGFLPGFRVEEPNPFFDSLPTLGLRHVDHAVGNQHLHSMESVVNWYVKVLQFHRFWSIDDTIVHSDYSALQTIVVSNYDETIKMPILESVVNAKHQHKSFVEEYLEYYGGPGIQHVAMYTDDIISNMLKRGVKFISVPDNYYDTLEERLKTAKINITEDLKDLRRLKVMVDFDEEGYLLQIFTKNMQDRPTFFLEVIQKYNHRGFGAGNFLAIFKAIEKEQDERGNLSLAK